MTRDPQTSVRNRRVAPRYDLRAPVEYSFSDLRGEGVVWNISSSGARIDLAYPPVASGTRLRLRFSFYPGSFETELPAEVVRRTETGFAVRFESLDEKQAKVLRLALPPLADLD